MLFAGLGGFGRLATRLATWLAPHYKSRCYLARMNSKGYVSPSATVHHDELKLARNVYIGDRTIIYQSKDGGPVELAEGVHLYSDIIIETGDGGHIIIGADTHIQPRCQLSAYKGYIQIGSRVDIAPNCFFYPYNHAFAPGSAIRYQPLITKGGIIIDDDSWLGVGVIVLDGVRIGKGAVVGAGSVVTHDVPDEAIAIGAPARIVKMRGDQPKKTKK